MRDIQGQKLDTTPGKHSAIYTFKTYGFYLVILGDAYLNSTVPFSSDLAMLVVLSVYVFHLETA